MKKIIFCLFLIAYLLLLVNPIYAISPSPSPDTSTSTKANQFEQQITSLKDRIASRVAELKLVQRRGVIGTVTDISNTVITLTDLQGKTRLIDVDELTKFTSPSAKSAFGISDITKGTKLGILGLYNKQSQRLLARFVNVLVLPQIISGGTVSVDSSNFAFTVATDAGQQNIDVETTTKTTSYSKDAGALRIGFSKIKPNQHVIVVGYPNLKDKNRISASSILVLLDIPVNARIEIPTPTSITPTITDISPTTSKISPTPSPAKKIVQ